MRRLLASSAVLAAMLLAGCGATQDALLSFGGVLGTVIDADTSAPISGAEVSIGGVPATSDSSGRFRIPNLPSGEQSYSVTATGYRTEAGGAVRIRPNVTVNLDVSLTPRQEGAGTVFGVVTRVQDGVALSGVTVAIGSQTATTDALGEYRITGVPAGEQTVSFTKPSYGTATATVTVNEDGEHEVNVTLDQVTVGSVVGTVVDSRSGQGIEGVAVFIGALGLSATTESDGSYALANVPAGTHDISYDRTGYQSETFAVTVVPNGSTSQDVSLVAPAVGRITGTVRDELSSLPVASVSISVVGLGRTATTGEDGSYTIDDIPTGSYQLTFARTGYSASTSSSVVVTVGTTTVYDELIRPLLSRIEGVVLKLELGGTTAVVSGATVRLGTSRETTTASDGTYAFTDVPPLADGAEYTIYAAVEGFRPSSVTVAPTPGEITVAPDIVLSPITN